MSKTKNSAYGMYESNVTHSDSTYHRGYTAKMFMEKSKHFDEQCAASETPKTIRQARKFIRGEGKAFRAWRNSLHAQKVSKNRAAAHAEASK